jgi:hypothetical protein
MIGLPLALGDIFRGFLLATDPDVYLVEFQRRG